jgi:hypothetical protein
VDRDLDVGPKTRQAIARKKPLTQHIRPILHADCGLADCEHGSIGQNQRQQQLPTSGKVARLYLRPGELSRVCLLLMTHRSARGPRRNRVSRPARNTATFEAVAPLCCRSAFLQGLPALPTP